MKQEIIALLGGLDFYILGGFNGIAIGDCEPFNNVCSGRKLEMISPASAIQSVLASATVECVFSRASNDEVLKSVLISAATEYLLPYLACHELSRCLRRR